MKQILKTYIPSACITFTLTTLCTCLLNLLAGHSSMNIRNLIEILAFIVAIDILDFILGYINFKTYSAYVIIEMIPTYVLMLLFGYFFNWFFFVPQELIPISISFFAVYNCVHSYFYRMSQLQAEEINKLIKKK